MSSLRARVTALEGEREMRIKLEKLLEVQTVQVDLQKELRVKTESLLQVEQQTTSKLRQQLEALRLGPPASGPTTTSGREAEGRHHAEELYAQAKDRIRSLERRLAEATAPETGDRVESHLKAQLEEQERLIRQLQSQMDSQGKSAPPAPEGEVVRLQLLLQSRDRHLDDMTQSLRKAQNDTSEVQSEADVLKHQVRVLKKEVAERTEEMEKQLNTERNLRGEVFQLQAKLEQVRNQHQEEAARSINFAKTASTADERQRRIEQLEKQLAEEQVASRSEREKLAAECEYRVQAKEQNIKNQTTMIASLNTELKERQIEIEKLVKHGPGAEHTAAGLAERERGGLLPPLQPPSPRAEDVLGQRSLETLHKQIKAKDQKIAKQTERLQTLMEMLEKRDQQLEELASARRDRETMRQRVAEMEEVLKTQPRVVTHAEAERRLIEQEQRMRESDRQHLDLIEQLKREQNDKEALSRELASMRGNFAEGVSNTGVLQAENSRLSRELAEAQRLLDGRTEELRVVREQRPIPAAPPPEPGQQTLPALQRRLRNLRDADKDLGRDVAVYLQERENKIEGLNSTIALLRASIDDLRRQAEASSFHPQASGASIVPRPANASPLPAGAQPIAANDMGGEASGPPQSFASFRASMGALGADVGPQPEDAGQHGDEAHQAAAILTVPSGTRVLPAAAFDMPPPGQPPLGQDARPRDMQMPQGQLHPPSSSAGSPRSPGLHAHPTNMPVVVDSEYTLEDLRTMRAEEIRKELISRRQEGINLEKQLGDKQQLILKLIEEANLCNAEVASLQQTVQQAHKAARKQEREYDQLLEAKNEFEKMAKELQQAIIEKENRITNLRVQHQEDTSGNAAVDEVDRKVGWKLKLLAPRPHEIRHSMFLVLNRRRTQALDKGMLAQGLALYFAISRSRIEVVEDARLPDSGGDYSPTLQDQLLDRPPSSASLESFTDPPSADGREDVDGDGMHTVKRHLVLININDAETDESGGITQSTISAADVLSQVRNDMLKGQRVGPIGQIAVDAVFINHGDMVLPFEWPSAQSRLLLREGRVLAGKHAVVTVHEVNDPYILRVVAYDTEAGREFKLFLTARDVILLLDTRDSESMDGASDPYPYKHLEGAAVSDFRHTFSVADPQLLDIIVSSLSFSVWQSQQILVASEMRIPGPIQHNPADGSQSMVVMALQGSGASRGGTAGGGRAGGGSLALRELGETAPSEKTVHPTAQPTLGPQPGLLPEVGITRGLRPSKSDTRRLYEDVLSFENRLVIFSLLHTTTKDLSEDMLRATVYYPKTCNRVEANLHQPMLSDRFRIVSEGGALDEEDQLHVVIVVEEIVYPPAFVVRLTSVDLRDAYVMSPKEDMKPHTHVIRVSKDGSRITQLPDMSFAVSPSTLRSKMLRCIGFSSAIEGPRETAVKLPSVDGVTGPDNDKNLARRTVTGHINENKGLRVQLQSSAGSLTVDRCGAATMPAQVKAQLRAKHGKGRLLVRQGRMLRLRESDPPEALRAVISVYERPQPYQHFVLNAYEPTSSREWEVLADSIDVFRLFTDLRDQKSRALDLAKPSIRERIAEVLVNCVELAEQDHELVLLISPAEVRQRVKAMGSQLQRDGTSTELVPLPAPDSGSPRASHLEPFEAQPAMSRVQTTAVSSSPRDLSDGDAQAETIVVEQRLSDRLFVGQRRLAISERHPGEPYKIQVYDSPRTTSLHSYVVIASPVQTSRLALDNLAAAIVPGTQLSQQQLQQQQQQPMADNKPTTSMLKLDDTALEDFVHDKGMLEPSRQEELLHQIVSSLHMDEDSSGKPRLVLRKKRIRQHALDASAEVGESGSIAPADLNRLRGIREVGGAFPLNRLRGGVGQPGTARHKERRGPSLSSPTDTGMGGMFLRSWKKIYSMAQRFAGTTVVITVSKRGHTYKLTVYEPEASALYEMCLVTAASSTPLNILLERADLSGKLDLVLCMHEVSFPHQVQVIVAHISSGQEFNLKIGDDLVFTMIENSRRDAFVLYFEQLITWGCIGFHAVPGMEEQQLANVFDETFAGNQIYNKTQIEDVLQHHLHATQDTGELKQPNALAPEPPRKLRVPVIRTQLDFLGKSPPATSVSMQLLYHAEHLFPEKDQTVLMRIHKRATTNDIAITLKVRNSEGLSLPDLPQRLVPAAETGANGRPFETPALGVGEAQSSKATEVTIWLQDKCSRLPFGAYGEICDIPGLDKQVLLLATDEDSPRAVRVAVVLAQLPFTVLFQVVLLEVSEPSPNVDVFASLKATSSRRVLQVVFQKCFGTKGNNSSAALSFLATSEHNERDRDLKKKLDDLSAMEDQGEHFGAHGGLGDGAPAPQLPGRQPGPDEPVHTAVIYMCTRQKLGRMMVFTICRDLIANNIYLRVVMHDPVTRDDCHITLMHYTTQKLLSVLRINRDMLEECRHGEPDDVKRERQTLRAELGQLIVDHLYISRMNETGAMEVIDHVELPDDEEVEYELRMRDILHSKNSADLTIKKKLRDTGAEAIIKSGSGSASRSLPPRPGPSVLDLAEREEQKKPSSAREAGEPKTLLELKEDNLLHKAERTVSGRRVLVAFYNETAKVDILRYSHNIRIVVACLQTLNILLTRDFHEDTLEPVCVRRNKRHLMSAAREYELVMELWDCLALQHTGQKVTGITFARGDE